VGYSPGILRDFTAPMRAGEWWDNKLSPICAAFYATMFLAGASLHDHWSSALLLLVAIAPGAVFVSVINDLTDRDEDRAAGKHNRLDGKPAALIALLVGVPIGVGVAVGIHWRHDVLLLSCYLCAWLAFSLYSIPPFRLKARGLPGVLCDASGAHLFPTLVAVLVAFRAAGVPVDFAWLITTGVWALASGLRGILWHQLSDFENDRIAGVRTFVQRHDPANIARLGAWILFPVELAALGVMLSRLHSLLVLAAFIVAAALMYVRYRHWRNLVILAPRPQSELAMLEYYSALFPLSILVLCALRHPADAWFLVAQLLMFPSSLFATLQHLGQVLRATVRVLLRPGV
jgi:4-hydroxybenzoate polyprenyltransferase